MIGSKKWLALQIQILNKGEDAFNALLEVKFPYLVSFIKADNMEPGRTLLCSAPKPLNNYTLQCEIGNPLGENSEITVRVFVQPFLEGLEESEVSDITFAVRVKSSNPEAGNDNFDNEKIIAIPIRVETDIRITGKSEPTEMEYNVSAPLPTNYTKETEIGEIVSHIYNVRNKGPSPIVEAIVHILWPSFNNEGGHLLYLLGFEFDQTKMVCENIKNLDPILTKSEVEQQDSSSSPSPALTSPPASASRNQADSGGGSLTFNSGSSDASRSRRSIAEFESDLESCGTTCTVIRCTTGPLKKDECVNFKIRSRLFRETQIKTYGKKVKLMSKMFTRVTRLPLKVPKEHLPQRSKTVTTTVIPTRKQKIPWWVWLMAILGGCLTLVLVIACLFKCSFFDRKRPEVHVE